MAIRLWRVFNTTDIELVIPCINRTVLKTERIYIWALHTHKKALKGLIYFTEIFCVKAYLLG